GNAKSGLLPARGAGSGGRLRGLRETTMGPAKPMSFRKPMSHMKRLAILTVTAMTVALAGCAAQRQAMGEYFDDAGVTTRVKKAIYDDPSLKVTQISVTTNDGVVHLTGEVESR